MAAILSYPQNVKMECDTVTGVFSRHEMDALISEDWRFPK